MFRPTLEQLERREVFAANPAIELTSVADPQAGVAASHHETTAGQHEFLKSPSVCMLNFDRGYLQPEVAAMIPNVNTFDRLAAPRNGIAVELLPAMDLDELHQRSSARPEVNGILIGMILPITSPQSGSPTAHAYHWGNPVNVD